MVGLFSILIEFRQALSQRLKHAERVRSLLRSHVREPDFFKGGRRVP
jgi:hypothetical protein